MLITLVVMLLFTMWFSWVTAVNTEERLDQMIEERKLSVVRTKASIDSMKSRESLIIRNQDTIKNLLRQR